MKSVSLEDLVSQLDTAVDIYDKRLQYQQIQLLQAYEEAYNAKEYSRASLQLEQLQRYQSQPQMIQEQLQQMRELEDLQKQKNEYIQWNAEELLIQQIQRGAQCQSGLNRFACVLSFVDKIINNIKLQNNIEIVTQIIEQATQFVITPLQAQNMLQQSEACINFTNMYLFMKHNASQAAFRKYEDFCTTFLRDVDVRGLSVTPEIQQLVDLGIQQQELEKEKLQRETIRNLFEQSLAKNQQIAFQQLYPEDLQKQIVQEIAQARLQAVQLAILKYIKQTSLEAHYMVLVQLFFQLVVDSVNLNLPVEQVVDNINVIQCLLYFKADKTRNQQFFSSIVLQILTTTTNSVAQLNSQQYQRALQHIHTLITDIQSNIKEQMRLAFVDKLNENISVIKYFNFCRQKIDDSYAKGLETELLASSVDALTFKLRRMREQISQRAVTAANKTQTELQQAQYENIKNQAREYLQRQQFKPLACLNKALKYYGDEKFTVYRTILRDNQLEGQLVNGAKTMLFNEVQNE